MCLVCHGGLFGRKIRMTQQLYNVKGIVYPVTVLKFGVNQVHFVKTIQTDGYNGLVVKYYTKEFFNNEYLQINMASDFCPICSNDKYFKKFGEFKISQTKKLRPGQFLDVSIFFVDQTVSVTGKKIGKGFVGNTKRHNFNRGPLAHGSKNHRLPGSIGSGTTPGRVYPGKRMAGRVVTNSVIYSKILAVDKANNLLILKGSVPGKESIFLKVT